MLVAVTVDGLGKVTLTVEQANCDEGQPHITGSLTMVAGQNPQSTGVNRQGFVQAEFG